MVLHRDRLERELERTRFKQGGFFAGNLDALDALRRYR